MVEGINGIDTQLERILNSGHQEWYDGERGEAVTAETVEKARNHIPLMEKVVREKVGQVNIRIPQISALSDGSIDVNWQTSEYELLLNVPPGEDLPGYYGDNGNGENEIEGKLPAI